MNPKIKIAAKATSIILLIFLTSFITKEFERWFKPRTEVNVVFKNCVFPEIPALTPVKDITNYLFDGCGFNNRKFGEFIPLSEVDEAIAKIDKEQRKK